MTIGVPMSEDDQQRKRKRKLELVGEVAREVWNG